MKLTDKIMKTKLIKTKGKFILVSDEEIKEGDYGYSIKHNIIFRCDTVAPYIDHSQGDKKEKVSLLDDTLERSFEIEDCIKIVAGIPELPSIDFSDLKEADCKEIGFIDVEKLAAGLCLDAFPKHDDNSFNEAMTLCKDFYVEGFKTAQSINDKTFSLNDMKKAIQFGLDGMYGYKQGKDGHTEVQKNKYIQSLQKTEWDVEVERDDRKQVSSENKGFLVDNPKLGKPLITNGKIKVIKIN